MIARFRRIQAEFGTRALLKTLLLLAGLIVMAVMGMVMFERPDDAVIAIVGIALGALARRQIANSIGWLPKATSTGLFVYGIVLFLGDKLGMDNSMKLYIITLATVVLFDAQFWSLSDPGIVNTARHQENRGAT